MKTTINKIFQVEEPIQRVWEYLSDPTKIVTCVPGASLTEKIDDRNFKGKVSLKFGPVKAAYDGEVTIEELDIANRSMVLKGKGVDTKGKGSADMVMNGVLREIDGGTEINYSMEVSVIGMLAQFGSRLIADVADQLVSQFVQNFKDKLKADIPSDAKISEVIEAAAAKEAAKAVAAAEAEPVKAAPSPPPAAQEDNSLNAFALMWAVIKGFFRRLFGGGK